MWSILRSNWPLILIAGLALFIPIGLLETVDASLQDALDDASDPTALNVLAVAGVALLHIGCALLGEVIFAGLLTAVARAPHASIGELRRRLPIGRLILADVAFVVVVIIGLAALIVPGIVFIVWFSLIGPVLEVEHPGVRDAFRRSRAIVLRRPWLVAGFVLSIALVQEALTNAVHEASVWALGETFAGEWASGTLAELLTTTPAALAATVLYLELSGAPRPSPRTRPPEPPRSRPAATA